MAFAARYCAVGPDQRELGFGMVEAIDVCPGANVMAGFAAEGGAVGAFASHAIVELTLVGILVAGGAGAILEMEGKNLVGASTQAGLVAIGAGDSYVSAGQSETRGLVLGDGIRGTMEIDDGMAVFAAIVVWRGGELVVVSVLVAIEAGGEFHFVDGVFARGNMALGAFHLYVFSLERIAGRVMFLHAE